MASLKVTVHEARDLPVMDRTSGLADPYVLLTHNSESHRTELIHTTRHPVWNANFKFELTNLIPLFEDPLEVRVYDHDIVTRDDLVGMVYIDLNVLLGGGGSSTSSLLSNGGVSTSSTSSPARQHENGESKTEGGASPSTSSRQQQQPQQAVISTAVTLGRPSESRLSTSPSVSGWFPLIDTMAGLRGEIRLTLRLKFHAAENPSVPRLPVRRIRRAAATTGSMSKPLSTTAADAAMESDNNTVSSPLTQVTSPQLQYRMAPEDLAPLSYEPTAADEEGVLIFSVSRLDPSVYRVESAQGMLEELIVKADPEHSKFTTLRSSGATNEARLLQLFKLSGKVRRQLAGKVLQLHCNAVLGYDEQFDMEPSGIIVRACGTPVVLSEVQLLAATRGSGAVPFSSALISGSEFNNNSGSTNLMIEGVGGGEKAAAALSTTTTPPAIILRAPLLPSIGPSPNSASGGGGAVASRSVLILTLRDVPCGALLHIGGVVAARSIKVLAKLKKKHVISQERDGWWWELRDEIKFNAKSLHCNAILGYTEEAVYDNEEVALLSISGTAVVIDTTWLALRCGPENLFHRLWYRCETSRQCAILHLYLRGGGGGGRHGVNGSGADGGLEPSTGGDGITGAGGAGQTTFSSSQPSLCTICGRKPVPDVLLGTCSIPLDLQLADDRPLLVQVVVSRQKDPQLRGGDLALAVSQALPFLEFYLHKQLLFKLQLARMNAAFGIRVNFAVCSTAIIAPLTATACRVVGLPIPSTVPKVRLDDQQQLGSEVLEQLRRVLGHWRRRAEREVLQQQQAIERQRQLALSLSQQQTRRRSSLLRQSGATLSSSSPDRSASRRASTAVGVAAFLTSDDAIASSSNATQQQGNSRGDEDGSTASSSSCATTSCDDEQDGEQNDIRDDDEETWLNSSNDDGDEEGTEDEHNNNEVNRTVVATISCEPESAVPCATVVVTSSCETVSRVPCATVVVTSTCATESVAPCATVVVTSSCVNVSLVPCATVVVTSLCETVSLVSCATVAVTSSRETVSLVPCACVVVTSSCETVSLVSCATVVVTSTCETVSCVRCATVVPCATVVVTSSCETVSLVLCAIVVVTISCEPESAASCANVVVTSSCETVSLVPCATVVVASSFETVSFVRCTFISVVVRPLTRQKMAKT